MRTDAHEVEQPELILIRARITQSFWREIRVGAEQSDMQKSDFVGDLLQRGMEARKAEATAA